MERLNCLRCQYWHEYNGDCTVTGESCTAVPAAHCRLLQKYLDTGLTPEECRDAKIIIKYAFAGGTSKVEWIRELLRADKEGRVLEKLKAYEDTGLTPGEIKELLHDTTGPLHHKLGEWIDADTSGRLVVLPCKVGDTVWAILDSKKHSCECKVVFVNIGGFGTTIVLERRDRLREQYGVAAAAFGKAVFLTREEAEEALRRAENG